MSHANMLVEHTIIAEGNEFWVASLSYMRSYVGFLLVFFLEPESTALPSTSFLFIFIHHFFFYYFFKVHDVFGMDDKIVEQ